jgi:peptidoglycan/LPS O-acetylase OafA/YrhL
MTAAKVRFPNLNGLRCVAALMVIVCHLEQDKMLAGLPNRWESPACFAALGGLGVVLFFVLSGFLITYLLLAEEKAEGSIAVGRFWLRRVLRIWPLYFLTVGLALFILPHLHFLPAAGMERSQVAAHLPAIAFLYLVFLANLVIPRFGAVPFASHTWSIGTEEQFYLLWPLLLKAVRRHRPALLGAVAVFYLAALWALGSPRFDIIPHRALLLEFWRFFNIDCMAVGGFFAALLFQGSRWLKLWMHPALFYATLAASLGLAGAGLRFPHLNNEIYALLFGLLILNLAANGNIKVSLENRILDYLGRISYGLYMFHPLGIAAALALARYAGATGDFVVYPLTLAFTAGTAALSYRYLETPFLRRKDALAPSRRRGASAPSIPSLPRGEKPPDAAGP